MIFGATSRIAARRAFTVSARQSGAHFKEGVYSNIPVKVRNRRIPFAVIHFGYFTLGFLVPFISSYVQLKKSGVL
ncbi:Cytochrome c oxidase polypeptide VIII [Lachancea thermotolerans]|uniref:Cytochrome c oxidase subunit 8, mitochondrial n=1 Tax=Lachancea thermotolerans (strain ATCC 56472 / CBS 6340 / NRRL Y-8284) TaxID=559295 RepID=C5DFE7_LACTC|nr:KLTH0D14498p [Lachancea thermotolerans CBS 6340]CAR22902.1 KLTH0D14498p [Lachancea thermotolerans CBS 6340]